MSDPLTQNHSDPQAPAPAKRPIPTLPPTGLTVAEYKRTTWRMQTAENVTLDDVLSPEYWAHNSQKVKEFDRIEVVSYDGTWAADLMVITTGRTAAKVKVLHKYDLEGAYTDLGNTNRSHEVKHRGPRKWSIIRLSDGAIVREDINTREEAEATLADYLKALAA